MSIKTLSISLESTQNKQQFGTNFSYTTGKEKKSYGAYKVGKHFVLWFFHLQSLLLVVSSFVDLGGGGTKVSFLG